MNKYSFFADTKLEVEQNKKKIEEKLIKPFFIWESIFFKGRNDHKLSRKNLNALAWSSLESQIDLPLLRFDLICSVPFYLKKRLFLKKKKTDWLQSDFFLDCNSPRLAPN